MKKIGMGVCLLVIQLLLVFPSLGGVVSQWNFNGLSGRTFFDSVGDTDLMFCYDNLAESFHELKYVSRVLPSQAGVEGRGYGSCVYLCNLKPEYGVYPEHAVIKIKSPDVLNFGRDSFTVTGWLKKDPVSGGYETIFSGLGDRGGVSILIGRADRSWAGKLLFEVKGSGSISIRSDNRVDDSCWHWFAAVSDQGSMRLFVDGVQQTAAEHYKPNTTVDLSGQAQALIGDGYTGYLDDISISREAFSEEILRDIYKNGLTSIGGSSPDNVVVDVEESRLCQNHIKVSEKIIFDGWKGESVGGLVYRLAGVAVIAEMPNDDLVAWCLTGQDNEPADDNCVITTRSSDRGKSWSVPEITLYSKDRKMIHQTAMVPLSDGRVVSFWAYLPWESKYTEWNYHRMYSGDCGRTWGASEEFKVGDGNAAIATPLQLANGEYFFPATVMERRTQPLVAPRAELLKVSTEEEAAGLPEGEGRSAGEFATHLWGCGGFVSDSQDGAGMRLAGKVANRPMGLLEPACVQLRDGRIVMLMRAQWDKCLWRSESVDNGRTWTDAVPTDIPNPSTMPFLLRLADGRIALINNNSEKTRDPLSIWISDDEMESWYLKEDVLFGGRLSYPYGLILKDNGFVFVYDHNRRQMRFVEVEVPARH